MRRFVAICRFPGKGPITPRVCKGMRKLQMSGIAHNGLNSSDYFGQEKSGYLVQPKLQTDQKHNY